VIAEAETMLTRVATSAVGVEGIRAPTEPRPANLDIMNQLENVQNPLEIGNQTGRHMSITSQAGNTTNVARGLLKHRLAEMA
jgi:hypothetical protein